MFFRQTKIHPDFLITVAIFTAVMSVYLFTLAPTVYLEDSGELITAAATLGIPHPSGYPLYVLLGRLFTFIPAGSLAWRVNLMSAVFGALTAGLLYLIIKQLVKFSWLAIFTALLLPFSKIFWSQSVVAEVYTLNSFFVALILLLLLIWQKNPQEKFLLWFAFIYGLSLTNHTMMALLAPAFGLYIWLVDKQIFKKWLLILKMLGLFILGLTVYLYLPLRSLQNPVLNWGNPANLKNFWAHISRQMYGDFSPLLQSGSKLDLVGAFIFNIIDNFYWPVVILSLLGLGCLFAKKMKLRGFIPAVPLRRRTKVAILTLSIFLLNSAGIIILRSLGWGIEIEFLFRVYYLPCYLMIIIWLAYFFVFLYQKIIFFSQNKNLSLVAKAAKMLVFAGLIFLPIVFLVANYKICDRSNYWLSYDYTKSLLSGLEPNSVFLFFSGETLAGDTELFNLMYLQMAEKFRTDVTIITDSNFFYKKIKINLSANYFKKIPSQQKTELLTVGWDLSQKKSLPLYTNFVVNQNTAFGLKLFSRSNGIIYKVYPSLPAAQKAQVSFFLAIIRNLDDKKFVSEYSTTAILSRYYYHLSNFYLEHSNQQKMQSNLIKAIALDPRPFSSDYRDFIIHRQEWQQL